ncbi:autotransporter outer membrane beta-barrel domain-containing protein, partial [Escherichia coli]|nr:autotransporter outer membrane beta-barrel domain-containing protein [Escherichia coli]
RNDIPEGIATLGAFMGYSHSHIGFDRGGHGSVGSYSLGGYASWEHESGFYLDGIVKLNRFESNVAGKMSSGGAANGSYRSNGLGGHIETGMRFTDGNWNLTPYASLTGFTADNPEYHLSNGMESKSVDTRSIYRELAVLNMAATLPLVFDAELNSIRERLNIMKASPHNNNVWGTTYNTRNNVTTDAGAGFEQTLTGMTVGIDSRNDIPEGIATLGAFMGYSHSHIGFDRGGHGSVGSYSLGGYASWEHESGFYLDGIVKLNRFESNVAGKMSSGGAANGSYHSNGLGGHIETGMRFTDGNWNLTPYASLTGFTADNPEYHLSNGMESKSVDTRSIYRELGATLSYNMRLGNGMEVEPWLKAAVRKEFVDDNRVKVNNDGNFVNDLSGRRGI